MNLLSLYVITDCNSTCKNPHCATLSKIQDRLPINLKLTNLKTPSKSRVLKLPQIMAVGKKRNSEGYSFLRNNITTGLGSLKLYLKSSVGNIYYTKLKIVLLEALLLANCIFRCIIIHALHILVIKCQKIFKLILFCIVWTFFSKSNFK